jgi:hypothetical protein
VQSLGMKVGGTATQLALKFNPLSHIIQSCSYTASSLINYISHFIIPLNFQQQLVRALLKYRRQFIINLRLIWLSPLFNISNIRALIPTPKGATLISCRDKSCTKYAMGQMSGKLIRFTEAV